MAVTRHYNTFLSNLKTLLYQESSSPFQSFEISLQLPIRCCFYDDSIQKPVKARLLLFVFNCPSQSEISQLLYWRFSNSSCIISFPISSISCLKYHTQDVWNASLKSISLFQSSFQNTSPLHILVGSSGSRMPCSSAVRDDIILNVEQGDRLATASSSLYMVYCLLEASYMAAVPFSPLKYSDQSASTISAVCNCYL